MNNWRAKQAKSVVVLTETTQLFFSGRFSTPSFAEFVRRRAARLDIAAAILSASGERVAVEVTGQRDLIDAFEMACSLGPVDCLVLDCARSAVRPQKRGEVLA